MLPEDLLPTKQCIDGLSEFVIQEAVSDWICAGGQVSEHCEECVPVRIPNVQL